MLNNNPVGYEYYSTLNPCTKATKGKTLFSYSLGEDGYISSHTNIENVAKFSLFHKSLIMQDLRNDYFVEIGPGSKLAVLG